MRNLARTWRGLEALARTTVRRASPPARTVLAGAAAYLTVAPLLALVHEVLAVVGAVALQAVGRRAATDLLPLLPVDPVYGGAALHVLAGIEARRLAVAGPLGDALHRVAPALFAPAALIRDDVLVGAVLDSGPTVVARTLVVLAATVPLMVFGIVLARAGRAPAWLAFAGGLLQAHLVAEQMLGGRLTLRELEATGLPFALAAFGPVGEAGQRALFTRQLEGISDVTIGYVWGALLAATTYLLAAGLAYAPNAAGWAARRGRRERWPSPGGLRNRLCSAALGGLALRGLAGAALAVALVAAPRGAPVDGAIDFVVAAAPSGAEAAAARPDPVPADVAAVELPAGPLPAEPGDPAAGAGASVRGVAPSRARSVVTLEGGEYRWTYRVDGVPTVIRGMGYNPWYARLARSERLRLYERDFGSMERLGINTIEGWFQDQFDELTLDAAHTHALGVIMPFELNHDFDYADPRVQAAFLEDVTAWVVRYRDHPAVRMWGPGNEMLHRLIFPTMVAGRNDPAREARADAFAEFFVELIDTIHALDPHHPVVYRDAEDLYFGRLRAALLRDGKPRPWFVYGANAYTPSLQQVIERWPTQGLDAPLLVSEFSPGGVAPADRPEKLAWFWSVIRARPETVLGGVVYTWATEGPEDLDRIFGLTDAAGRPIDGSLAALGRLFRDGEPLAGDPS